MNNEKISNELALIYDNQGDYKELWSCFGFEDIHGWREYNAEYWLEYMLEEFYEYDEKENSYFGKNVNNITWLDVKKHLNKNGILMLVYDAPDDTAVSYVAPEDGPQQLKYYAFDDEKLDDLKLYEEPSAITILFFNRDAYKEVTGLSNFTKKGVKNITDFYADNLAMSLFMRVFGDNIEYDEDKDKYVYNEEYQVTKYRKLEVKGM